MIMNYYITQIDNVAANNSPELARIEYFDKDYYYEINCIEKTYKKTENNLDQNFYYNLTGLNLDSNLVMELGDISNMKNIIKVALNFDNKFEVSKKTTGDYVITLKRGKKSGIINSVPMFKKTCTKKCTRNFLDKTMHSR